MFEHVPTVQTAPFKLKESLPHHCRTMYKTFIASAVSAINWMEIQTIGTIAPNQIHVGTLILTSYNTTTLIINLALA